MGKLPPMDGSLLDKLTMIKCLVEAPAGREASLKCLEKFIPGNVPELLPGGRRDGKPDRKAIQRAFDDELVQFRHWLLTLPKLPVESQSSRMGIRSFHHPELFAKLSGLDPWERLLQITDALLWGDTKPEDVVSQWKGKSIELEEKLRGCGRFQFDIDKILRGDNACGSYLGKLAKRYPARIPEPVKRDGYTIWTINPPSRTKE